MTNRSSVVSPQTRALDCDSLLRSCIQSAVGLLQDPSEHSQRNVRRVEILLGLLSEDADNACKGESLGPSLGLSTSRPSRWALPSCSSPGLAAGRPLCYRGLGGTAGPAQVLA